MELKTAESERLDAASGTPTLMSAFAQLRTSVQVDTVLVWNG